MQLGSRSGSADTDAAVESQHIAVEIAVYQGGILVSSRVVDIQLVGAGFRPSRLIPDHDITGARDIIESGIIADQGIFHTVRCLIACTITYSRVFISSAVCIQGSATHGHI